MAFEGLLYRALDPRYARDPLSGEGARRFGGRFNPKGVAALYTALSPHTAIREANQAGHLQPTVLVAYEARIERVFDATDADALEAAGVTAALLSANTWRDEMLSGGVAGTQAFAERVRGDGFDALRVPSFAPGAAAADVNLVLLRWGAEPPAQLRLVDDQGRLR